MIKIDHAQKYYNRGRSNELHVINDLSIELPERGMVAIFGRSGCGKTTLLNAIGGLDGIDSGSIQVFGEDMSPSSDEIRNKYIGYIFQNYNLCKGETVFENVANALRLCGMTDADEIRARVLASLKNVGMEKFVNRSPDTLSGGQQQRVAIARALVKAPSIILADEPTGNLDEANTVTVMDILKQASRSCLVLLVTHEASLVDYYCDKVVEIVDGAIASVKENSEANGYFKRDKNDIYLGELEMKEISGEGVRVEYYGEPREGKEIPLKLVNFGGRLYLRCDDPAVRLLDATSEIKLKEGVWTEAPRKKESEHGEELDMSHLKSFEGGRWGRLFTFKRALIDAHNAFFSARKKKSSRLLRICLALLAIATVFMSANFAVCIRDYTDIADEHADNVFFIPLTQELDTSCISNSIGSNGIRYARLVGSNVTAENAYERFTFRIGNFMSGNSIGSTTVKGIAYDYSLCKGKTLVSGDNDFKRPLDTVITTAVADTLIKKAGVSFIREYDDLINVMSSAPYDGDEYIRIIGVVEGDENAFYFSSLRATQVILDEQYGSWLNVTSKSLVGYEGDIPRGSIVAQITADVKDSEVGSTLTVFGKEYNVLGTEKFYNDIYHYATYVYDTYGIKLLGYEEYKSEKGHENACEAEWLFDYYSVYLGEYIERVIDNGGFVDIEIWAYLRTDIKAYKVYAPAVLFASSTADELYYAMVYREKNGRYPDAKAVTYGKDTDDEELQIIKEYYEELDELWGENDLYSRYDSEVSYKSGRFSVARFIMNDEDYITLAYTTGKSSPGVYGRDFSVDYEYYSHWTDYKGNTAYDNHLMVLASDVDEAREYLLRNFGADTVITPEDTLKEQLSDSMETVIADAISLGIVVVLICVCVFLIMRSSVMSRIREIGIYRAIGVSKRNIVFKMLIETLLLVSLSLLIGFIIASVIVSKLANSVLTDSAFYYPVWFALIDLAVLYASSALSGILPVALLLRKTPSEIISKYDI